MKRQVGLGDVKQEVNDERTKRREDGKGPTGFPRFSHGVPPVFHRFPTQFVRVVHQPFRMLDHEKFSPRELLRTNDARQKF